MYDVFLSLLAVLDGGWRRRYGGSGDDVEGKGWTGWWLSRVLTSEC